MCNNGSLPKSQRLPKNPSNGQVPQWDSLLRVWVAANPTGVDPNLMNQIQVILQQNIIDNLNSELTDKSLSAHQGKILNQLIATLENSKQNKLNFTPENSANKNAVNGYLGLDGNARASADALSNLINDSLSTAGSRTWSIDQIKSYVSALVDTTVKIAQAYIPDGTYPTQYNGHPIQAGDSFRCATGQVGTIQVNSEDLLIARIDNPGQNDENWMVIEGNRSQSTESNLGLTKLVRQSDVETTELTDNLRSLTVLRLSQWWSWTKAYCAMTWEQIITFTQAPILSSATAGHYLKVDELKAITSVESIPISDIQDGESILNKSTDFNAPDHNHYPSTLSVAKALKTLPTQRCIADYTLTLSNAGGCIEMNVPVDCNVYIPEDASVPFDIDTQAVISWYGVGQPTIVGAGAVVLRAPDGLKIAVRYGAVTIKKIGPNEWYVWGRATG